MRFCIKKQKSKIKQEKGITLIALAVTIVIIIILAGITINGVFGDDGVLKQAKGTQDKTSSLIEKEEDKMNYLEGEYINVINEDRIPPSASIVVDEITEDSITIFVNVTDNTGEPALYKYYIDGEEEYTSNTNMYTFNDLGVETSYTIKVEVYDNANNKTEVEKTISTSKSIYPKVEEKLKAGDYVYYIDAEGITRKCVVLYDNTFSYGIQIIAMDTVEDVTIGNNSDMTAAINSYNDVVSTLNSKAALYNNEKYSTGARSVGTMPNDPDKDDAGYFVDNNNHLGTYDGMFKDSDKNYLTDYNQMGNLGIQNLRKNYWLASRNASAGSFFTATTFNIYSINNSGQLSTESTICYFRTWIGGGCYTYSYGLRPVFTLKNGIRISGGSGTPSSPYTLGILY